MITAFASSIVGLVGGISPDLIALHKSRIEHKHEIEKLKLNSDPSNTEITTKEPLPEVEEIKEFPNLFDLTVTKPSWIDSLNALLRPLTVILVVLLFTVIASMLSYSVYTLLQTDAINLAEASNLLWNSLIGEAIQAVLGFLFGYRSSARIPITR